ncbi:hypothetical protein MTO96_026792 [Rhipicephalus appendiculatus]
MGITEKPATKFNDDQVLQYVRDTMEFKAGRYQVRLPWKENVTMGDNKTIAEKWLMQVTKKLALDLNLSLLADPTQPTRIGNNVCRDDIPDFSFCRIERDARWCTTHVSFASDHYVLVHSRQRLPCKPRPHMARHTDWDAFRKHRLHSAASNMEDLTTWTNQLLANLEAVTASIPTTEDHPAIDSLFALLWAALPGPHQPLA